jgi:hypothetical protein
VGGGGRGVMAKNNHHCHESITTTFNGWW